VVPALCADEKVDLVARVASFLWYPRFARMK